VEGSLWSPSCCRSAFLSHLQVKYYNVYCLASLVAGLSRWYDEVGVCVVDDLLEEVRIGLEVRVYHHVSFALLLKATRS
jgi:hypothetical protein